MDKNIASGKPNDLEQGNPPTITKARRWFYANKIINLFWFEGELPRDLESDFSYLINPDWPDGPPLPESIQEIIDLSEAELEFVCMKMKRPEWSRDRHVLRGKTSLREMDQSWPLPPRGRDKRKPGDPNA